MLTMETTRVFRRPFALSRVGRPTPAGTLRPAIDEEDIPGPSSLAFERVATMPHVSAMPAPGGSNPMFVVDADERAAPVEADPRDA